jgi:hypothetical protein
LACHQPDRPRVAAGDALGLALWWAYSTVWQRGYDVAAAEGDLRLRGVLAQIEAERRQSEREARDAEQAEREQQAAIGQALRTRESRCASRC